MKSFKYIILPNYETTSYKSVLVKSAVLIAFALAMFYRDLYLPAKWCEFFSGDLVTKVLAAVWLFGFSLIADEAMYVSHKREQAKKQASNQKRK